MELLINEGNKDPAATSQTASSLAACGMIPASATLSNTCPDVVTGDLISGIFYTGRESIRV